MRTLRYLFLLLTAAFPFAVYATIVPAAQGKIYTSSSSAPVVTGTSTAMTSVFIPDIAASHLDLSKKGVITFGVDHHYTTYFAPMTTVKVELYVEYWNTYSVTPTTPTGTTTIFMEIAYNTATQTYEDKQMNQLSGYEAYTVKIVNIWVTPASTGITGTTTILPANLYVHADLFVDRIYDFSTYVSAPPTLTSPVAQDTDCDGVNDQLILSWGAPTTVPVVEEYQLEWTYINDYTENGSPAVTSSLLIDFKRNSTRISTVYPTYPITLAFDQGYICYRVRAVGRGLIDPTKRIYGAWTALDNTTVGAVANYHHTVPFEYQKNWQYSTSYAEEGKKKEVISFFDGTLRNRQTVTKVDTDNSTIVGETIYDHQGRAAIQVLPVPVQNLVCGAAYAETALKYYRNLSLRDAVSGPSVLYSREDFDKSSDATPCVISTGGMRTTAGASNYYSTANPNQAAEQAFVPDAEKYPFSQVEYMPDNTGRIRRQSGVGDDFKLGSNHESKFYYSHPSQVQLDRMFGSEVGDAAHYQKNMVIDPNGQVSVSYLDQEGRVIATSLAGASPLNLQALESAAGNGVALTDDLFAKNAANKSTTNHLSIEGNSLVFNETMSLSAPSNVTLNYTLDVQPFTDPCLAEGICLGCVYDLSIRVKDDCGVELTLPAQHTKTTGTFTLVNGLPVYQTSCTQIDGYTLTPMAIVLNSLPIGTYQVTKTLTVNEAAKDAYVKIYLDPANNTCVRTLDEFEEEFLANVDFEDCETVGCAECVANLGTLEEFLTAGYGSQSHYEYLVEQCQLPCKTKSLCETTRELMMTDMSPGGQYGKYMSGNGVIDLTDPLSVYRLDNSLPQSFAVTTPPSTVYDWQRPRIHVYNQGDITEYREEDGITRSRVQVVQTYSSTGTLLSTVPAIVNASFVYTDANGERYTYPENLANVKDFADAFKKSWANSLLVYHPEFYFYKTCLEFTIPINSPSTATSESFDDKMKKVSTWASAEAAGFLASTTPSLQPNVDDRITNYALPASQVFDPFRYNYGAYSTELTNKIVNYVNLYGTWYSMMEYAALIAQHDGALGAASIPASWVDFGANTATRDEEWNIFRSLYYSAKQEIIRKMSIHRSVGTIGGTAYLGYNGCIQNTEFNAFDYGFLSFTGFSITGSQYISNLCQPCGMLTHELYKYKTRRFTSPTEVMDYDPNNVAYQQYLLSGECPQSITMESFLTEAATTNQLELPSFAANGMNTFSGFYLVMNNNVISGPTPAITCNQTATTTQLQVSMTDGLTPYGTIRLDKQVGEPVSFVWADILDFSDLHYVADVTGGTTFTVKAIVDQGSSSDQEVLLDGFTSFDLALCGFDNEANIPETCELNKLGNDIRHLLTAVTTSNQLNSTTAYQIQGGAATLGDLVTNVIETASNGTTATNFYWKYDVAGTKFQVYSTATSPRLDLDIVTVDPVTFSLSSLGTVEAITAVNATGGNTFDIICEDASGTYLATLHCVADYFNGSSYSDKAMGACEIPCTDRISTTPESQGNIEADLIHDGILQPITGGVARPVNYSLYKEKIKAFNSSDWASANKQKLSLDYRNAESYESSVDHKQMDSYIRILDSYISANKKAKLDPVPAVPIVKNVPNPCDINYQAYLSGVTAYNTWAAANFQPVLFNIVTQTAYNQYGLCSCVLNYSAELDDIMAGNIVINGGAIKDLYSYCRDTTDPCVPASINTALTFPTEEFANPCTEFLTNITMENALNAYEEYINEMSTDIAQRYMQHCIGKVVETFTRSYTDEEYHFTLYYYDQAGNLIKTVPPEGVELLATTSYNDQISQSIKADRATGTHKVITSHRLASKYEYNSLNQLIRQNVPDQESMDIWDITLPNGLPASMTTTAIQMVNSNTGYLSGFINTTNAPLGTRGYLYRTENGGANWTRVNNTVAGKLNKVQMMSATVGYAIGESGLALRTIDGVTWDLFNTYGLAITGEFADLYFTAVGTGRLITKTGIILTVTNGNTTTPVIGSTPVQLALPSGVTGSIIDVTSMQEFGSTNTLYTVTVSGTPAYSAIINNVNTTNVSTFEKVLGANLSSISYYSATEGYAAGVDGNLIKLITPASGTGYVQSMVKSGLKTAINQVYFLNADRGIAVANENQVADVWVTYDGGTTWSAVAGGVTDMLLGFVKQDTKLELTMHINEVRKRLILNATGPVIIIDNTPDVHPYINDRATAGYIDGTVTHYVTGDNLGQIFVSSSVSTTSSDEVYNVIGTMTGEQSKKIVVKKMTTNEVSIVVLTSSGKLFSFFKTAVGSTYTMTNITPSGVVFADIALNNPSSGNAFVIAYNATGSVLYRTIVATGIPAVPVAFTTTAVIPSTVTISGIAISSNRITAIGNNGALYTTSLGITATSTPAIVWNDRSSLRLIPLKDLHPISASGLNYVAVGDNGTFLKRSSTLAQWNTVPLTIVNDLSSVSAIASNVIPLFCGSNGLVSSLDLTSGSPVYYTMMNSLPVDQAISGEMLNSVVTNGNMTYIAGNNGTLLYSDNPAANPFAFVHSEPADFRGMSIIPGQSGTQQKVIIIGSDAKIYRYQGLNGSQLKQVFGPKVNDVHFDGLGMGTFAGTNYFVRRTTDGGLTWKVILPSTTAQLSNTINRVWTRKAPNGAHFAIMGGAGFLTTITSDVATNQSYPGTIRDIQFNATQGNTGYATSDANIRALVLFPGTNTYTVVDALINLLGSAPGNINAIHVFDNTSIMAVGNSNMVSYLAPGGLSFSTMTTGIVGTYNFTDVYFHDNTIGYLTSGGTSGMIHRGTSTGNNATTHAITGMSWETRNVIGTNVTAATDISITAIAFGSRYEGVWGGVYVVGNTTKAIPYVRRIHDESEDFTARFFYDRLGRIVVSQNSRQYAENKFSYTLYDPLGRVTEAGEKEENASPKFATVFGATVNNFEVPTVVNDTKLLSWLNTNAAGSRKEVTKSYYDATAISAPITTTPTTQRKRIIHVTYSEVYNASASIYDHATHYDYDIHGNVKTIVQDNKLVAAISDIAANRFKRTDYNYDVISGNVHRVDYQNGQVDQWHHAYTYDMDNRITQVYTTTTTPLTSPLYGQIASENEPGMTPYWDREAAYTYYDHGPLARIELGEERVQGLDYIYTIHGWTKDVNSNTLNPTSDPGRDGVSTALNKQVARDVSGYSLHYFAGDYQQIGTGGNAFVATQTGSSLTMNSADLYNGNIARMVTTITDPAPARTVLPLGNAYSYDQLNRLKASRSFDNLTGNTWGNSGTMRYYNTFSYDANGNITQQYRADQNGALIDNLTYRYNEPVAGKKSQNRLYHVNDAGTGVYTEDIEDMGTFVSGGNVNTANNYSYDNEGRLIKDVQEKIAKIIWRVDGKVKEIQRISGSSKRNTKFDYDAMGNRIAKHEFTSAGALKKSTYYMLDAQGNTLSVYERAVNTSSATVSFVQAERHIYGSSRLGVMNANVNVMYTSTLPSYVMTLVEHKIGDRNYELTNHLGNVLSVISDKPIPHQSGTTVNYWLADIRQSNDYSPFGVQLEGRKFQAAPTTEMATLTETIYATDFENPVITTVGSVNTIDGWTHYSTTTLSVVPSGGSQKLQIVSSNGAHGAHQYFAVAAGVTHTLNIDVNIGTAASGTVNIVIFQASGMGGTLGTYTVNAITASGTYAIPFSSSTGYSFIQIRQSGTYLVDNISITKSTSVSVVAETNDYRYGFNGKEEDDEIKGEGNSYDFGARMLDPRLGRWLTIDPLAGKYPFMSPYCFVGNSPIIAIDPDGRKITFANDEAKNFYKDFKANADRATRKRLKKLDASDVIYQIKLGQPGDMKSFGLDGSVDASPTNGAFKFKSEDEGKVTFQLIVGVSLPKNEQFSAMAEEVSHAEDFNNGNTAIISAKVIGDAVGLDIYDEIKSKDASLSYMQHANKNDDKIKLTEINTEWAKLGGDLEVKKAALMGGKPLIFGDYSHMSTTNEKVAGTMTDEELQININTFTKQLGAKNLSIIVRDKGKTKIVRSTEPETKSETNPK